MKANNAVITELLYDTVTPNDKESMLINDIYKDNDKQLGIYLENIFKELD